MLPERPESSAAPVDWIWIVPKWPLPPVDGARQATTRLLTHLAAQGANIHLAAFVPDATNVDRHDAVKTLGVSAVSLLRKWGPDGVLGYLCCVLLRPALPMTLARYSSKSATRALQIVLEENPDAVIVFDGLHSAAWVDNPEMLRGRTVMYRAHNVERDIWERSAEKQTNPVLRILLRWQKRRVEQFEKYLCRLAGFVLPVSDEDGRVFDDWQTGARIETIPIGMNLSATQSEPTESGGLCLLYVGRLDWPPNRDGLKWFLENVWTQAVNRNKHLGLCVVGSGEGGWLKRYATTGNLRIVGWVESVEPYYEACTATIVPVFYGSGTRVKAIEASAHGRACVSTALGVEGIGLVPGVDYWRCETADEWIETLANLQVPDALRFGRAARRKVATRFDAHVIAKRLLSLVSPGGSRNDKGDSGNR